MKKRSIFNKISENFKIFFKTIGRWASRAFFGSHRELSLLEEEAVQSPIRVTINKFFHKKLAIFALSLLVFVFAFCFVGSALTEGNEMFIDIGQANTTPGFNMLSVPGELKKAGIKKIASATTYSVGISKDGKVYAWGNSLGEIFEGYYQVSNGDETDLTKLDPITGEYVTVHSFDEILSIKKSFKLINESSRTVKDVFAGPDVFFIVLDDNTVVGYGIKGDSTSFASSILTETLQETVRREGVYNITMDSQVVAIMTNDDPNGQHGLHIWGNIGLGKARPQIPDSIVREIEKNDLNPIDVRWTRDTLVVLFDNGTFKAFGGKENSAVSSQPSNRIENLTIQIAEKDQSLLETFKDQVPGYNSALAEIEANIANLEAELTVSKTAVTEAKAKKLLAENNKKQAEIDLENDPTNETLIVAVEAAKLALEKAEAELNEAEVAKENVEKNIVLEEAKITKLNADSYAASRELAKNSLEYKVTYDLIMRYEADLALNKVYDAEIKASGVKQLRATKGNVIVLLNNGKIITWGDNSSNENLIPEEYQGKFASIQGDTMGSEKCSHIITLTTDGDIVGWGASEYDALMLPKDLNQQDVEQVFANYYSNYAVDEDGNLVDKWGLSGYAFGTDERGRSTFIRVMHGGKISLTIGLIAVVISAVIGIIVGGVAGFYGGWVDTLMMRLCEVVGSIPFMPIAMTLSLVCNELGFRDTNSKMIMIMLILGLLSWTGLASLIRAHILAEREKEFVTAAQAIGVKSNKIIFRHIIPNVITIIIISITSSYAGSLLTESGLSYLGFGVEPPSPTWGNMLTGAQNMNVIKQYWWRWVFPSIFLCCATVSINLIGDCIRDAVDPRSTER